MAHGILLPVAAADHQWCYEGCVVAKGGLEYRLKLTIPSRSGSMSMKNAKLECDWELRNLLRGHETTIQKRLSESSDLDQFLLELKAIIQRQESSLWLTSGNVMSSSSYNKLMADLDELGWSRVIDVSSDLSILKLRAQDTQGRDHVMTLNISSQYPSKPPTVSADVPLAFKPHWNFPNHGATLLGLVQQFEQWLLQFDPLWTALEKVDEKCWVLEPEKPTRACTYRRVVIGENLSLHMVLQPLSPTLAPQLTFLGADHDVHPLMSKWSSCYSQWDPQCSLLENLTELLAISFSSAPEDMDMEEEEGACAICYAYRFGDHTPSVVCENKRCSQVFHNQCIYDWLRSLQAITKYFNKITGECPNCGQSISSTAPS